MNYMVRDETVRHPQTGNPYRLTSYSCYVTSQDQIENFYSRTGYGGCAVSDDRKEVGGVFTRIPIENAGLEHADLKYPSQYRSQGHKCVNQRHIDSSGSPIIERLIGGDVHVLEIREIEVEEYGGYVYDLVDVSETHNFSNAMGIVTGNCCAYQFAATFEKRRRLRG